MIERKESVDINESGIDLVDLRTMTSEIHSLVNEGCYPHVLLQSRQFVPGERCLDLYSKLSCSEAKTIVNVDSSARNNFCNKFEQVENNGNHSPKIRYTHEKYSKIPVAGHYVGRNHVRMILVGEQAYLSSFDFAEPSFDRDELFIKITHPEILQMMKTVCLWDYDNPRQYWQQKTDGLELLFDTGKTSKGYLSRYAEKEVKKRLTPDSKMWIVSSWCPDELEKLVNDANSVGSEINLLINRRYEYESLKKVPFNITKILSDKHFRSNTSEVECNIYNPTKNQIHAKFVMLENANKCWWLVGTTNHTKFGSSAMTTELGIAGEDKHIGEKLMTYIENTDKIKV